ncbi:MULTISPECIES: hypothetical protein [Persephonella]|nr:MULTISPECIES: hypothetical protein [Persephonella]
MRYILIFLLFLSPYLLAETVEERLEKLEKKIIQLERRIQALEGEKKQKDQEKDYRTPVEFTVLSKKFKPVNLRERLWEKGDKIVLYMKFKNITGKAVRNIKGIVQIEDISGRKLMETEVNINKALNFITGMDIKPDETVEMKVSFLYDNRKPEHRYVKESSIEDLKVLFKPLEVEFSDGTVINFR